MAKVKDEDKCYSNDINGKLAKNTQEFMNNEWTITMADAQISVCDHQF